MQKHFGARGWLLLRGALFVGALARFLALVTLALHPRKRKAARARLRFFGWQMGRLLSTSAPPHSAKPGATLAVESKRHALKVD
ncbi:hypothetical protein EON83_30755 [bacterium]|nr:MAG: hypothetical protein EON83_30755 [bacterium]